MQKRIIIAALVVIGLFAWHIQAQNREWAGERWEYAAFSDKSVRKGKDAEHTSTWEDPSGVTKSDPNKDDTDARKDLIKKLGGNPDEWLNIPLFNLLGSRGWEFVRIEEQKIESMGLYVTTWHFKRRVR